MEGLLARARHAPDTASATGVPPTGQGKALEYLVKCDISQDKLRQNAWRIVREFA